MEKQTLRLPTVDISKAKTHRSEVAQTVVDGLESTGFLFIENVQDLNYDQLYKCCQWFFGLPMETKKTLLRNIWNSESSNVYRGYFPVSENEPSRKEGFEFGRDVDPNDQTIAPGNWFYEKSVWPNEDGTFPFKKILLETYDYMHETALEILQLAAIGLGIDEHAFEPIFSTRPMSTFRLIHYPPWGQTPPANAVIEDGKVVTTPDHTDSSFLTLLTTFNYKGLEILAPDGRWVELESRPNTLVMNIGDVFSRMMGGRFKATRHRVIDIGIDRYSVPFFLEPSFDGDIGINFLSKYGSEGPDHVVEKYGPWVMNTMKNVKKFFEYRHLPEF